MKTNNDSITTERLIGERITERHFELLCDMHNNQEVMKILGGVRSDDKTQQNLEWNMKQWADHGHGLWMFKDKENSEFVGRGGIRKVEVNGKSEIEVGYALMPEFWNKGYATEISNYSVGFAFSEFDYSNLVAFTMTTNKPSEKVMQKTGFKFESEIIHADIPHVLYRIHKSDWKK